MSLEGADNHIKSRIYSYESEVPSHLWDNIERQLRPRRRRGFYWFLVPIGLLGIWYFGSGVVKKDITPSSIPVLPGSNPEKDLVTSHVVRPEHQRELLVESQVARGEATALQNALNQSRKGFEPNDKQIVFGAVLGETSSLEPVKQAVTDSPNRSPDMHPSIRLAEGKQTPNPNKEGLAGQISRQALEITSLESRLLNAILQNDPDIDICPSFSTSLRIKPFVEVSISGGLPSRNFSLGDAELQPYHDLRENTEKTRSSITVQAIAGLDIGEDLEVKTGLGLTRIFEVFDYIDQSATRTITNIVTDTIFVNGQPQVRTDTNIVTEYGQRIKLSQNSYTFFDIPVLAAYKFDVRHHRFFIQGGVAFNFAIRTRGDILTADEQIVSIDTRDRALYPVFKNQGGIDLLGAVGYEYALKEKNALRIMASFRHMLSDMTVGGYPIGQKYDQIQLGISWKHQF